MKRGVYKKESRLFSKGKESWLKKNRVVREIGGGGGGGVGKSQCSTEGRKRRLDRVINRGFHCT